jgi:hypothetical protein
LSASRTFAHRALAATLAILRRCALLSLRCLSARAFFIAALRCSSVKSAHRFYPIALAAIEMSMAFFFSMELRAFAIFMK